MLVPIDMSHIDLSTLYYGCFVNTYTKGRTNIPDTIRGKATIYLDKEGFHGSFALDNPEIDSDAEYNYTYVIGSGFYSPNGGYIGNIDGAEFKETIFYLQDAIDEYKNIKGNVVKEIWYDDIKN